VPAREPGKELSELVEQLKHFDVGMMVTQRADGRPAARPMYVAELGHGGVLHFVTHRDAAIADEIAHHGQVAVTFQRGARYLSLTAHATISDNKGELARLWKESFRLWFPDGPSSPEAVVIRLAPQEAEYWDQTGIESIRLFVQAAKAFLQREPLEGKSIGRHGHVDLEASTRTELEATVRTERLRSTRA
jgi:general stress protein 26